MMPTQLGRHDINDHAYKLQYQSYSGWSVGPHDVHAGDIIKPDEYSTLPSRRLLVLDADHEHGQINVCDYCNDDKFHLRRRGYMPADYAIIDANGAIDDEPVAYTCHACIAEAPVVDRHALDIDPDDVYTDTWSDDQ